MTYRGWPFEVVVDEVPTEGVAAVAEVPGGFGGDIRELHVGTVEEGEGFGVAELGGGDLGAGV